MKKKKISSKKPLLVAPWKIGFLVALLLVVVGVGAGYYLVKMYKVDLGWMGDPTRPWEIDSYRFFKEMYPLVASVAILSLISYFLIASAVRRYRSFLESGQDYRAMIAIAESIDDLTNSTQISKLSAYPELQSVLRNYGDSIREISKELERKEMELNTEEVENQIDTLFRGEQLEKKSVGGKWWKILGKVADCFKENRQEIEELAEKTDAARRTLSKAVLSHGKLLETVSKTSEDLLEIIRAVGELNEIVGNAGAGGTGPAGASAVAKDGQLGTIVDEMVSTLNKLEEGGRILSEFSTENNGLALNMALKAAKGGIAEQDLAHYAEKMRSTAERFNRLSGTVSSIAQGLLGNCYTLTEKIGGSGAAGTAVDTSITSRIGDVAGRLEEKSQILQGSLCNLGSEFNDVYSTLQEDMSVLAGTVVQQTKEKRAVGEKTDLTDGSEIVNFGGFSGSASGRGSDDKGSDMVIEHGALWDGGGFGSSAGEEALGSNEYEPVRDVEALDGTGAGLGDELIIDEMGSLEEQGRLTNVPGETAEQVPPGEIAGGAPGSPGAAVGEAPEHNENVAWENLQHEKRSREKVPGSSREVAAEALRPPSEAAVQGPASPKGIAPEAPPQSAVPKKEAGPDASAGAYSSEKGWMEMPGHQWVKIDVEKDPREQDGERVNVEVTDAQKESEPVYDLFELGAVEYVEETKT